MMDKDYKTPTTLLKYQKEHEPKMCKENTPETCSYNIQHNELISILRHQVKEQDEKIEKLEQENAKRFDTIIEKLERNNQQQIQIEKHQAIQDEQNKTQRKRLDAVETILREHKVQLTHITILEEELATITENQKAYRNYMLSIVVVVIGQVVLELLKIL